MLIDTSKNSSPVLVLIGSIRLSLHYLVKCRSPILTIDNNEFIVGSACVSSENY